MADQTEPNDLSRDVRGFIAKHIGGVEQLEILMLMVQQPSRYWDVEAVADSLQLSESAVARHLEDLAGHGLLDVRLGSRVTLRFSPVTPDLERTVQHVAHAYKTDRAGLIALCTPRRRSLRDFSDAFRFRGDPTDG